MHLKSVAPSIVHADGPRRRTHSPFCESVVWSSRLTNDPLTLTQSASSVVSCSQLQRPVSKSQRLYASETTEGDKHPCRHRYPHYQDRRVIFITQPGVYLITHLTEMSKIQIINMFDANRTTVSFVCLFVFVSSSASPRLSVFV